VANQLSARNDFGIELSDVTAYHPAATAQAPPAIQGLNLSIGPGEHVAVIGPSGSGKTSCLLVIAAALKVKSGKVSLNHQSVWELAKATRYYCLTCSQITKTIFLRKPNESGLSQG
jgi:ABC-type transport system involved in cytochrome bd biosynthesis fused ATPase/permease subunit